MNFIRKDELLKRTTSRCPTCQASCPAEVWRTGGIPSKVFLRRTCPDPRRDLDLHRFGRKVLLAGQGQG